MSDEEVRALERRFAETKGRDDEVALLRAKLRAGGTTKERLRVAAFLGHEAATLALEQEPTPDYELRDKDIWIARLKPLGKEAFVRAVVALARARLVGWDRAEDARPRTAIEAAEAWVLCPCDEHRAAAERAYEAADEASDAEHPDHAGLTEQARAVEGDPDERLEKAIDDAHRRSEAADLAARAARCASRPMTAGAQQDFHGALRDLDPRKTPALLAAALVPWALERGDPIKSGAAAPAGPRLTRDEEKALAVLMARFARDPALVADELAARLSEAGRRALLDRLGRGESQSPS